MGDYLRYALSFAEIDKIIVGVDSLHQFNEVISACMGPRLKAPRKVNCFDPVLTNPAGWVSL
jgi:hypothetical protein